VRGVPGGHMGIVERLLTRVSQNGVRAVRSMPERQCLLSPKKHDSL
jgi:hypothetical protein